MGVLSSTFDLFGLVSDSSSPHVSKPFSMGCAVCRFVAESVLALLDFQEGQTPLHLAAMRGRTVEALLLLDFKAAQDLRDQVTSVSLVFQASILSQAHRLQLTARLSISLSLSLQLSCAEALHPTTLRGGLWILGHHSPPAGSWR